MFARNTVRLIVVLLLGLLVAMPLVAIAQGDDPPAPTSEPTIKSELTPATPVADVSPAPAETPVSPVEPPADPGTGDGTWFGVSDLLMTAGFLLMAWLLYKSAPPELVKSMKEQIEAERIAAAKTDTLRDDLMVGLKAVLVDLFSKAPPPPDFTNANFVPGAEPFAPADGVTRVPPDDPNSL